MVIPASAETLIPQPENVRTEYARVLKVEPVYQTLRASNMEEQCEQVSQVEDKERSGIGRVVDVVKDAFTTKNKEGNQSEESLQKNCRYVPVEKEFKRPIAYDVHYVHHGVKYRSRLPYDPGNRMKVRVAVSPIINSPSQQNKEDGK